MQILKKIAWIVAVSLALAGEIYFLTKDASRPSIAKNLDDKSDSQAR